jgi:multimeric flavodoxin WrbA
MAALRERIRTEENIVLATPVYVDGMTGLMKNMLDRLLPLLDSRMEIDGQGRVRHGLRNMEPGKRIVLVSTCGFRRRKRSTGSKCTWTAWR